MKVLGAGALAMFAAAFVLGDVCLAQEPKTLNESFAEGSKWTGIYKHRSNANTESSGDIELEITKRDGKNFEGQYRLNHGKAVVDFKGTITGNKVRFRITKVVATEGTDRNVVGLQFDGELRRDAKSTKPVFGAIYNWPDQNDVRVVRRGRLTVTLDE